MAIISLLVAKARSNESTTSFVNVAIPHSRGGKDPMNRVRGTETTASVSEGLPITKISRRQLGEKTRSSRWAKLAATPRGGRGFYTRASLKDKPLERCRVAPACLQRAPRSKEPERKRRDRALQF